MVKKQPPERKSVKNESGKAIKNLKAIAEVIPADKLTPKLENKLNALFLYLESQG